METIKTISFIIPVYNEKMTVKIILDRIEKTDLGLDKEIVLIDDYSTDGTRLIIEELPEEYIKIYHTVNKGKGAAVRSGVQVATGDLIVIQDADLEYDPADIKEMLKPVLNGDADVVYGSRFLSTRSRRASFFWHMVGNKFLTLLTNMISNIALTDMETCYKLFKGNVIKNVNIEENRFGFEPEITIKISRMNCRIYEVGISYYGRSYLEGKKITWKDGFASLKCIILYGLIRKIFNEEPFLEKYFRKIRIKRIRKYINKSHVVCDIGCGKNLEFLKSMSSVVCKCIGIDKKVPEVNYSNIETKRFKLNNKIPLENDSIDVVTMLAVLEHLDNPTMILQEIKRILKPEGLLLITVPSERAKLVLEFLAYKLHLVDKVEIMEHKRYYNTETLKALLVSIDFEDLDIMTFKLGFNIFCSARKESQNENLLN